jgi:hypothetical protein
MSIALPVRRRRPIVKGAWVYRLKQRPMSALQAILEFVTAPVAILLGASLFTREVQTRHRLRVSSYWISAFAAMKYECTLTCPLAARTRSSSNGLGINRVLLGYGRGNPFLRAHDRGYDRPEHHTRDARGESGLSSRLMGEAEGRQR